MSTTKFTYNQLQTGTKYRLRKRLNQIGYKVNGTICQSILEATNEIYKTSLQDNPSDYELALKKQKQATVSLSKIKSKYDAIGNVGQVIGTHKVQGYLVDIVITDAGWTLSSLVFQVLNNGSYVSSLYGVGQYKPTNIPFRMQQHVAENKIQDYYFLIA